MLRRGPRPRVPAGAAHRRAIKAAPVQVGQRLRVPGLVQVRRSLGRDQLIELTIERDVR